MRRSGAVASGAMLVAALCALAFVAVTFVPGLGVVTPVITASAQDGAVNPRIPLPVAGADDLPPPTHQDDDLGTVAVYRVDANANLSPRAPVEATFFWDIMVRAIGAEEAAARFRTLEVSDAPDSDLAAYVIRDRTDPHRWTLGVNVAWNTDVVDTLLTAVHEYGHVLSLDGAQVAPDTSYASCDTLYLTEGCADEDGYIMRFQERFWSDYVDAPEPESTDTDVTDAFYEAHEDDFVSRYAATSVLEDFAESFSVFVVEGTPSGSSVTAQKLRFFARYPEFTAFRDRVLAEFDLR